ncbi:hypothetical protein M422DRAFT_245157 [Sphaerobolus stellatus SS14]|nr:hypothetical protein M422DRAFT_245157 [Sphaerobolus stellatus SS14]
MLFQAEYDALFKLLNSLPITLPDHSSASNLPPQIDPEFTAEEGARPAFNKAMHVAFGEFGRGLFSVHTFANTIRDDDYRLLKARPELKTSSK